MGVACSRGVAACSVVSFPHDETSCSVRPLPAAECLLYILEYASSVIHVSEKREREENTSYEKNFNRPRRRTDRPPWTSLAAVASLQRRLLPARQTSCPVSTVPCLVAYRVPMDCQRLLRHGTFRPHLLPSTIREDHVWWQRHICCPFVGNATEFTTQVFNVPTISFREHGARVRMQ
jgi:hypothetical protein